MAVSASWAARAVRPRGVGPMTPSSWHSGALGGSWSMVEKNKGCGGPFHLILVFYKVDTLSL